MRLLADENFPGAAVSMLQGMGHDIVWVRTEAPGIRDAEVLAWAARDERVLLTFDKDFGELAGNAVLSSSGVILFRLPAPKSDQIGRMLAELVSSRADWIGHFSVTEPGRIRMRRLPTAGDDA